MGNAVLQTCNTTTCRKIDASTQGFRIVEQGIISRFKLSAASARKSGDIKAEVSLNFINAMILVENPVDAIRLISGGIKVPSVNIGSISFDATRKMVTDTIAVNHDDVTIFIWMHRRGIVLDYRKVPSDAKKDFWKCLCEKEFVHDTSQKLK